MKINSVNNINFQGYKNLISHGTTNCDGKIMYMAMELFDDEKNKDLSAFREIKNMILPDGCTDDVITFTFAKHGESNEALFLDGITVPDDMDLKICRKKMSNETFEYYEKVAMKIYTLLASLTKRIMNEVEISKITLEMIEKTKQERNEGMNKVLDKFSTVTFFLARGNKQTARSFMETSLFSCVPPQKIANSFHRKINKRMLKYFNL